MSLLRQLLVLLVVSGTLYGGYVAYGRLMTAQTAGDDTKNQQSDATPVEVASARNQELATTVEAVGTTRALKSVEIVSEADGRIGRIAFTAGDRVSARAVLVELDSDIERADLAQAKAELVKAQLELDRAKTLRASNIAAKATVDGLTANLAAAIAAVSKTERRLADRTIKAPFAGMVGMNRLDAGSRITDATVITTLDDLSSVQIEFSVSERLFGNTRIGHKVEATTAAYGDRVFVGKVAEIDSRIDPVSRSFKVRALVPNEDGALPAGMFMHIRVILEAAEALVVPEEAVIAEAEAAFVFVIEDGLARRQQVTIGRRAFGVVEVLSGLRHDARVVTRGNGKLRNGAPVAVLESTAEIKP